MEFDANEQALRESGDFKLERAAPYATGLLSWLYGMRDRARDTGDATQRRAVEARDTAGAYINRHPFSTVALALVIGFAAGALIARR